MKSHQKLAKMARINLRTLEIYVSVTMFPTHSYGQDFTNSKLRVKPLTERFRLFPLADTFSISFYSLGLIYSDDGYLLSTCAVPDSGVMLDFKNKQDRHLLCLLLVVLTVEWGTQVNRWSQSRVTHALMAEAPGA